MISASLRTEPGATTWSDYLLVGEPTVYTPREAPRPARAPHAAGAAAPSLNDCT